MSNKDKGVNGLGDYLKYERENRGLRLKEIAEKAGISIAYLNRLENNKRLNPSFPLLIRLANSLEVSIIDLLQISLKTNDVKTKDIRDIILDGDYLINGKQVPEEVRKVLYDIIKLISSKEWQQENEFDMVHKELIRKIKYLNNL